MESPTSPQLLELLGQLHIHQFCLISYALFFFLCCSLKNQKKHSLNNISKSNIQSRFVLFHVHFSFFLWKTIDNFFSIMYEIVILRSYMHFFPLSIVSQQKNNKQHCFNKFYYLVAQSNIHLATPGIAALIIAFYLLHLISLQAKSLYISRAVGYLQQSKTQSKMFLSLFIIHLLQGVLCLRCFLRLRKNNRVSRKPCKQRPE